MSSTFHTHRHDAWVLSLALFDVVFVAMLFVGGVASTGTSVSLAQVTPPPGTRNAACVSISGVPSTVVAGSSFPVTMRFKNTGTLTWNPAPARDSSTGYKFGPYEGSINQPIVWQPSRGVLPPGSVAPNAEVTISFTAVAPMKPGVYRSPAAAGTNPIFGFVMMEEGVAWFGAACGANITVTPTVLGNIDTASGAGGNVEGWAFDPQSPTKSIDVHYYIDRASNDTGGIFAGSSKTTTLRADVNATHGITGNHGFSTFRIPDAYRDGNTHTLWVRAIDAEGKGAVTVAGPLPFTLTGGTVDAPLPRSLNLAYHGYYTDGRLEDGVLATNSYTNVVFAHPDRITQAIAAGLSPIVYLNQAPLSDASWATLLATYKSVIDANRKSITALYFTDEPIWNNHTNAEIQAAADRIERDFPLIKSLIVEAVPGLGVDTGCMRPLDAKQSGSSNCVESLKIPTSIDYIGFDAYGVRDPRRNDAWMASYERLKSKRSRDDQKIFIVGDAWWHPWNHGQQGVYHEDLEAFARNYYELAKSDPDIVGIAQWVWDGFEEDRCSIINGVNECTKPTRELPQNVRDTHREIGREIMGIGLPQDYYLVTNFNNSGTGSLRDAVSQSNRYVYFNAEGTINLSSDIDVKGSNITIDGTSAPGNGVTLNNFGLRIRGDRNSDGSVEVHDVIVKKIRVRDAAADGIQVGVGAFNVLLDHVSVHGSADGNLDVTGIGTRNVTVQNSIIANPRAGTTGDDVGDQRNMLLGNGATEIHLYNNVIGFSNQRNPEISFDASSPFTVDAGTTVDMRNNIIWDWTDKDTAKKNGERAVRVEFGSRVNVVNNLFGGVANSILTNALTVCRGGAQDQCDSRIESKGFAFTSGNVTLPGNTLNLNTRGNLTSALPVTYDNIVANPHTLKTACIGAEGVRAGAGSRPLDAIDTALLASVGGCPEFSELFTRKTFWDYQVNSSKFTFKAWISNHGNVATPATSGTLRIDNNVVATLPISSIGYGSMRSVKWSGPVTLTPGRSYTVRFCIDMGETIPNPDDSKKCTKGVFSVGVVEGARPGQADLIINRFLMNSSLYAGQAQITGQAYVYNQGLAPTTVAVPYEFTVNGTLPTTVRYRPRVIAPGGRATYRVRWSMPSSPGKHSYAFRVDPTGVVSEANELNNDTTGHVWLVETSTDTFPALTAFTRNLKKGTNNGEVKNVQQFLADQFVLESEPTGFYGTQTEAAVREFQVDNDLAPTGEWNDATRALANEIEGFTEQTQPSTMPPPARPTAGQVACPAVTLTLDMWNAPRTFNDTYSGGQVSALQEFLWQYRDVYEWNLKAINKKSNFVTGAYNTQTANAVEFFQQQFGIAKKGDDEYGKVYRKTRDEILRQCGALAVLPNTSAPDDGVLRPWWFADMWRAFQDAF